MHHDLTLRGHIVTLEPLRPEHADDLCAAIAPDDDVFRWTNTSPRTQKEMLDWIEARSTDRPLGRAIAFAQRDVRTGRLMGSTSLFDWDEAARAAEIGHTWLAAPYRRSGANTEAKLMLLTHAFETMHLARVQIVTDLRNDRSSSAIARLGATREGVLRNHRLGFDRKLRDSVYYSFIDREWASAKPKLAALLR